ncbi:cyclopropane-fatty-acyl-phospholipid synthase family protein [Kitasatospora sp. NPDC049258]|uniref:cyclopropane-fatty-acyl-phospholipid synthase family protein n=1 Tax=Kitasatospora sp. NPDC049258 TaxID=3155394 RepID=UPI003427F65A
MTAAARLAPLIGELLGSPLPFRLRAWDGSTAGPTDAPTVILHNRRALRRLVWQPGELGLADAYISGDLDVEGDLGTGLLRIRRALAGHTTVRPAPRDWPRLLAAATRLGVLGPRPGPPAARAAVRGEPHSRARDRAVIRHHYDLSNEFYALLLGSAMAYSCGYWTPKADTLAEAQDAKFDLICRKLGLEPGMRLLDVGCGWGALAVYAARHHGVRVTAVTLSRRQYEFGRALAEEAGVADRIEFRRQDYRELAEGAFDAVSCVEMGEHVGDREYPAFAARLFALLRPEGRLLVQQMSRGRTAPGGGAFIEAYIAPDMHMRPVGETVALLEDAGLEVRQVEALREHYARTIDAWHRRLEEFRSEFVALVGVPVFRLWRLYLVGSSQAFAQRRMGVDQILAVRPTADGGCALPATCAEWYR